MFFSTSPLPFCRQLINNKQLGDIEVAIRSIKGNVDRAKARAKKAYDMGYLEGISQDDPRALGREYDTILSSSPKQMAKRYKSLAKEGRNRNHSKKRKMGGGKIYTSMDKKYGGGIFPRKGNM